MQMTETAAAHERSKARPYKRTSVLTFLSKEDKQLALFVAWQRFVPFKTHKESLPPLIQLFRVFPFSHTAIWKIRTRMRTLVIPTYGNASGLVIVLRVVVFF